MATVVLMRYTTILHFNKKAEEKMNCSYYVGLI
jgi:hypothetical protein